MNREGRTYRSERSEHADCGSSSFAAQSPVNGSLILVTRSKPWNPERPETSNYTHEALVLECPLEPGQVGRSVQIDERMYGNTRSQRSTFETEDGWVEV